LSITVDSLRLAIANRLSRRPATAAELAVSLEAPAERVRYHLRRMREAGLVEVVGAAPSGNGRANLYGVNLAKLVLYDTDLADLPAGRLEAAHVRLLRLLFAEAMEIVREGRLSEREEHALVRFPVALDDDGLNAALQLHEEALTQVLEAERRCKARLAAGEKQSIDALAAIVFFKRVSTEGVAPNPSRIDAYGPTPDDPVSKGAEHEVSFDADPLRFSILTYLTMAPAGATELADLLQAPVEKVRYQLRRLAEVGLVTVCGERLRRGTVERIYVADSGKAVRWGRVSEVPAAQREKLDALVLNAFFREALAATKMGTYGWTEGSMTARIPMKLDQQGMTEVTEIIATAVERMLSLRDECHARLATAQGEPTLATSGFLFFAVPDDFLEIVSD